jgi:hypothetical protein
MFVMMVGIASGAVARRGVSGRLGSRNFAGRISRASSLLSKGGEGGNCISSGCNCRSSMAPEAADKSVESVKMVFVSPAAISVCRLSTES